MFFDELTPIVQELTKQPVAFMGGLFSGLFRLNLAEDPLKSWLEKQGASVSSNNDESSSPKSINID